MTRRRTLTGWREDAYISEIERLREKVNELKNGAHCERCRRQIAGRWPRLARALKRAFGYSLADATDTIRDYLLCDGEIAVACEDDINIAFRARHSNPEVAQ